MFTPAALMTFSDLVEHYRQTELLADNKTEKTRTTCAEQLFFAAG
jgi:hypothetical protein